MFCADYISSFICHGGLSLVGFGLSVERTKLSHPAQISSHFAQGAFSGFLGACAVHPFDFVRKAVIKNSSIWHNFSTIPYSAAFFGVYFSCRDENSLASQCKWASTSATLAVLGKFDFLSQLMKRVYRNYMYIRNVPKLIAFTGGWL